MSKKLIEKALAAYIEKQQAVTDLTERGNAMWEIQRANDALNELDKIQTSISMMQRGGDWLGAARNWIQCKFSNGDTVIWGSDAVLRGKEITVRDIENLSAIIAAAAINEYKRTMG